MTDAQDTPVTAPDTTVIVATPEGGAPAAGATPAPTTIAAGATDPTKPQAPADFPEDWRAKMAGSDAKELKRLERYGSPTELYKAYRTLEQKLSSGQVKQPLAENATPEQVAEWRKDNGIPDAPEGYDTALKDIVIGENDKPAVSEFLKKMHESNASPAAVKSALSAYYGLVEQQAQQQVVADEDFKAQSLNELQTEWGVDFRKNVSMVSNLLATAPEGLAARIEASRTPEGRKVGDDPAMMKWLNQMAREVNPAAAVVPNAGSNAASAMAAEKAALESIQHTAEYTPAKRARYVEIVEAEMKMNNRAA